MQKLLEVLLKIPSDLDLEMLSIIDENIRDLF